jgi:hypothetical protein
MNRNDIIRMAREAGFEHIAEADYWHPYFERFAALAYEAGAAAERAKFFGPVGWMDPLDQHIRHNFNFHLTITPRTCAPEIEVYLRVPEGTK